MGKVFRQKTRFFSLILAVLVLLVWVDLLYAAEYEGKNSRVGNAGFSYQQGRWVTNEYDFPRFAIGAGSFANVYDSDNWDNSWGGLALRFTAYINKHFAIRSRLYSTVAKDTFDYDAKISGLDFGLMVGSNWAEGFNVMGGLGFYTENFTWDHPLASSDSWSGGLVSLGIGYQWRNLSLELVGDIKDPSDPESYFEGGSSNATYTSGSLTLEYIFD